MATPASTDVKHAVFLVHGMGVYQPGWEKTVVESITAAYNKYEFLKKVDIGDRFEFVPVGYDDIFQEIVKNWGDNAAILAKLPAGMVPADVQRLTSWMQSAGELKNNFLWTHAADVLLYRAFRLVRERVCASVATQIIKKVTQQYLDSQESSWSVIA